MKVISIVLALLLAENSQAIKFTDFMGEESNGAASMLAEVKNMQ